MARGASRRRQHLSAVEARRVVLAAQGFADGLRERRADGWALRRVLTRVGLLQMDSVNAVARAHYLPLFARLGPYPVALLDRAASRAPRRLFEYWGHEASLLPVDLHRLLRWRMERAHVDAWGSVRRVARERPQLLRRLLDEVRERGPVTARELAEDEPRRSGPWWDWSDVKWAIEFLFWRGAVTTARRRGFERMYDLPERVLPRAVLEAPTPPVEDAQRELMRIAARGSGVATERHLRDYFRLDVVSARARVAELVEAGELLPVRVEGWNPPAYLWHGARVPRAVDARALVGPFDSLMWERERVEQLFGMRYRIEIYTPAHKRVYGYYVMPFLLGDRLVARVDLKADRPAGVLRVPAIHLEDGAPGHTHDALREELELMAGWLGLAAVDEPPRAAAA
ncbi:MAG TPA: crosslink repair DNA glycosylase YcaQ family protein [Solirubrobacterales bacterium]|nr:crosslink repair DNA glycosylase YcaQ family protein [Solirubrobacterales bacterium]